MRVDGVPLRTHLESLENQTGITPEKLIDFGPPFQLEHIWNWYEEVTIGRGSDGFGPAALSYADIYAWVSLLKIEISPWEVKALRLIDQTFRNVMASSAPTPTPEGTENQS